MDEGSLAQSATYIRVDKVIAYEKQWLVKILRQRVGEAVTEVESGRVAAALAKSPVGLTSYSHLLERDGYDRKSEPSDQGIKLL